MRNWGASYEDWVNRAFRIDPRVWDDGLWVSAYQRVSAELQAAEGHSRSTGGDDEEGRLIRTLVFGQRSFLLIRALGTGRSHSAWVDLGAGTGGSAAGLLANGAGHVRLVDRHEGDLKMAEQLLDVIREKGQTYECAVGEVSEQKARMGEGSLWCFSWNEVGAEGLRWLEAWWDNAADAPCWLVEPGTRKSFGGLKTVRDRYHRAVRGPCPSAGPRCPMKEDGDWCHFTWNVPFGPAATRILQRAGRNISGLHASYLELQAPMKREASRTDDVGKRSDTWRILDRRRTGKVDRWLLCDGAALRELETPNKGKRAFAPVEAIRAQASHALVHLRGPWRTLKNGAMQPTREAEVVPRETKAVISS
ncbi:MAG: small ribosomal subunit Rsm22 family protein [Myxococcota bacterium]